MNKCLLVINKNTRIAEYLEKRALYEITEERKTLSTIDIDNMDIIDVDKLLFIYYAQDSDIPFRSDMNALRKLLQCSFFNVDSATFILVDNDSLLLEDLIMTAVKSSNLSGDKLEVIQHKGALLLEDVAKYLSGAAIGTDVTSAYNNVYITEADTDERDRFENVTGTVKAVLPVLTDAAKMYNQRARAEAASTSRNIVIGLHLDKTIDNFSDTEYHKSTQLRGFLFSGEDYCGYELGIEYLSEYFRRTGQRTLVVSIDMRREVTEMLSDYEHISVTTIRNQQIPGNMIIAIDIKSSQFGYLVSFLGNLKGVENYIFITPKNKFAAVKGLVQQLCDSLRTVYVTHFTEEAVQDYLNSIGRADTVFLSEKGISSPFDVRRFREQFKGTVVAELPLDNADYSEFYNLVMDIE